MFLFAFKMKLNLKRSKTVSKDRKMTKIKQVCENIKNITDENFTAETSKITKNISDSYNVKNNFDVVCLINNFILKNIDDVSQNNKLEKNKIIELNTKLNNYINSDQCNDENIMSVEKFIPVDSFFKKENVFLDSDVISIDEAIYKILSNHFGIIFENSANYINLEVNVDFASVNFTERNKINKADIFKYITYSIIQENNNDKHLYLSDLVEYFCNKDKEEYSFEEIDFIISSIMKKTKTENFHCVLQNDLLNKISPNDELILKLKKSFEIMTIFQTTEITNVYFDSNMLKENISHYYDTFINADDIINNKESSIKMKVCDYLSKQFFKPNDNIENFMCDTIDEISEKQINAINAIKELKRYLNSSLLDIIFIINKYNFSLNVTNSYFYLFILFASNSFSQNKIFTKYIADNNLSKTNVMTKIYSSLDCVFQVIGNLALIKLGKSLEYKQNVSEIKRIYNDTFIIALCYVFMKKTFNVNFFDFANLSVEKIISYINENGTETIIFTNILNKEIEKLTIDENNLFSINEDTIVCINRMFPNDFDKLYSINEEDRINSFNNGNDFNENEIEYEFEKINVEHFLVNDMFRGEEIIDNKDVDIVSKLILFTFTGIELKFSVENSNDVFDVNFHESVKNFLIDELVDNNSDLIFNFFHDEKFNKKYLDEAIEVFNNDYIEDFFHENYLAINNCDLNIDIFNNYSILFDNSQISNFSLLIFLSRFDDISKQSSQILPINYGIRYIYLKNKILKNGMEKLNTLQDEKHLIKKSDVILFCENNSADKNINIVDFYTYIEQHEFYTNEKLDKYESASTKHIENLDLIENIINISDSFLEINNNLSDIDFLNKIASNLRLFDENDIINSLYEILNSISKNNVNLKHILNITESIKNINAEN